MNHRFFVVMAVVAALLVGCGLVGSAAAQEATETENASAGVEAAAEAVSQSEADTMANTEAIRMDEYTRIVGWEFVDDTVRVAVETERTQRITISDGAAGVGTAGATRVPEVTERVFGGETTIITMPVDSAMGGHVVGVTIGGDTVRLSTEMSESGDDPFQYFGGESGLFSGMGLALLTSIGAAGYVLWREDNGVMKA